MINYNRIDLDKVVHTGERAIAVISLGIAAIELGRTVSSIVRGRESTDEDVGRVMRIGRHAGSVAAVAGGVQGLVHGIAAVRTPYSPVGIQSTEDAPGADGESDTELDAIVE